MRTIFPTVIHEYESSNFNKIQRELIEYVYNEKRKDPVGEEKSNVGGWQSKPIFVRTPYSSRLPKEPNILSEFIIEEVVNYFTTNRILKSGVAFHFTNMWVNINKNGDYNLKHTHENSDLSGVFYLKVFKDCGNIVFDNPHSNVGEIRSYSSKLSQSFNLFSALEVDVKPGKFVIFPSSLVHKVQLSKSREDRISSSFNIKLL
tara:strand:+ start:180 stop:788 length:609 start_codon:yes stop_codon:yes gene_type:complete